MKSLEEKSSPNIGISEEISGGGCMRFEFHKSNGVIVNHASHHRMALGKSTPSKWDDAQKWLVNLSRGEKNQAKASPRNSNADDRRLIVPVAKKDYSSDDEGPRNDCEGSGSVNLDEVETKNVDCDESVWRINKPVSSSKSVVRSICVRDMGTEMTPIASQEPSRAATPVRAARSPIASDSPISEMFTDARNEAKRDNGSTRKVGRGGEVQELDGIGENSKNVDQPRKLNPLEIRAMAWDEAERAKYTARYKREELKIQALENQQKRKAEMEMEKTLAKAERLKSRAQEKYASKLAVTKRVADERRANAEAKLNEMAVKTSERADYIRRTGRLPSNFSFNLSSFCW